MVGEGLLWNEQWRAKRGVWSCVDGRQTMVYRPLAAASQIVDESTIILQTAAQMVSGNAVYDIVEGLGRLEGQLAACYDGQGVIHVPVALASTLIAWNLVEPRNGQMVTTTVGNIVIFGGGYTGTAPSAPLDPSPATTQWIYATGAMFIYRSTATVFPIRDSFDRAENTVKAIAERTYVLGWDCCHYAVQVSMGGEVAGSSGLST